MGTTTHGLPYPEPTDPVADGAAAIKALAEALDALKVNRVRVAGGFVSKPDSATPAIGIILSAFPAAVPYATWIDVSATFGIGSSDVAMSAITGQIQTASGSIGPLSSSTSSHAPNTLINIPLVFGFAVAANVVTSIDIVGNWGAAPSVYTSGSISWNQYRND